MELYPAASPSRGGAGPLPPHLADAWTDPPGSTPGLASVQDRAGKILAAHVGTTVDGWCAGCLREGYLIFHPCCVATWAAQMTARYGVVCPSGGDRT